MIVFVLAPNAAPLTLIVIIFPLIVNPPVTAMEPTVLPEPVADKITGASEFNVSVPLMLPAPEVVLRTSVWLELIPNPPAGVSSVAPLARLMVGELAMEPNSPIAKVPALIVVSPV